MQILVLETKPFVGLLGPDLGSELIIQTNLCATGPFGNSPWSWTEVSPEKIWGDARTKSKHPCDILCQMAPYSESCCN